MRRARRWLAAVVVLAAPPLAAQNLFVNADLDSGSASWVMGCGTQMDWQADDEAACPGSGSLHLLAGPCQGTQGAGAGQCVSAGVLGELSAAASVRAGSGFLLVVLEFFDSPDCSGTVASQQVRPVSAADGQWHRVTFDNVAIPGGTGSILVGFGAAGAGTADADVDAGYAGALPLVFRDDFEGNLEGAPPACRWSAVSP